MNVLHISSDYPFTSLYQQLLMHFSSETGQMHIMYVPLATKREFTHKYDCRASNLKVLYSRDFRPIDRFFYHRKRSKICTAIEKQVPLDTIDLVHAHYLFAAGGVAYAFKETRNIDYVVAVRSSDLNCFFKLAVHLRSFGISILKKAARVVFLSPAYRESLINTYVPEDLRGSMRGKSVVIPNGINDYWLDNVYTRGSRKGGESSINLLFVGEFTRNKNIETSIKVARLLRTRGYEATITIVGSGPDARRIRGIAARNEHFVKVHSWVESKEDLLQIYRKADIFIMPSFAETFGLAYVEAMSQGLPVIYTKGQGIDGYFEDGTVGYACNPSNVAEIADKVERIIRDYDKMSATCVRSVSNFSWRKIACEYEAMYRSIYGQKRS